MATAKPLATRAKRLEAVFTKGCALRRVVKFREPIHVAEHSFTDALQDLFDALTAVNLGGSGKVSKERGRC